MKPAVWARVILSAFVAVALTCGSHAADVTPEDRQAAAREKEAAISRLTHQLDELESERKRAAKARRIDDAKRSAAALRTTQAELDSWKAKDVNDLASELAQQRAQEQAERDRRLEEERQRRGEQKARRELADRAIAAREMAGCPLAIEEVKPDKLWYNEIVGERLFRTRITDFLCRIKAINAGALEIKAWEMDVEKLDAFGKVLEGRVAQGLAVRPQGEISPVVGFDQVDTGLGVRVSIKRVVFADGSQWTQAADHLGVSVSRMFGKEMRWDFEELDAQKAANGELPAGDAAPALPPAARRAGGQRPNMVGPLETLAAGEKIVANLGEYAATVLPDGNLVIYRTADENRIWATGTSDPKGAALTMLEDGNAVLRNPEGKILWSTGTAGHPGACLFVQDDGNFCVYTDNKATQVLWTR